MKSKPSPRGTASPSPSATARLALVAFALIALVATGVWWGSSVDDVEIEAGRTEARADEPEAAGGASPGDDQPAREVDAGAAAFEKDGSVGTAEASAAGKRTRNHVLVRVIDARTKEPVADAEVVADPYDEGKVDRRRHYRVARYEENLVAGEKATTDAEGHAWLRLRDGAQVAAAKGDLFGARDFSLHQWLPEGFELRIAPLESFVVRVRGVDGTPRQDVPIGLATTSVGGEIAPQVDNRQVGRTKADGSLEIRLAEYLESPRRPDAIEVFVCAPGLVSARAEVGPGQREVALTLPPHGSVRLRAVRADREPHDDEPGWYGAIYSADSVAGEPAYNSYLRDRGAGGTVRFPYVGLGRALSISFESDVADESAELAGPVSAGQEVVHTFAIDDSKTFLLAGRVLDAEGKPLVGANATCVADDQAVAIRRTDPDGRFCMSFHLPEERTSSSMRIVASAEGHGVTASAAVPVQAGRRHDFGELVVSTNEPVAKGVLIADGPLGPGVRMSIQVHEGGDWNYSPDFAVLLEDDGRFAVHRIASSSRRDAALRLSVYANGFLPVDPVDVRPGQELRIELKRGPRFHARLLLDPAIHWFVERSGLDLLLTGPDGNSNYLHSRLVDGEWWFESASVTPGIYNIALESGSAVDDLAQLEGVRIFPGEDPDPRLLPWDLRSTVQMLTVRLRREDGSKLQAWGDVYRKRALDGEWESCASFDNGIAQSLTTAVPADLFVEISEHGFFRRSGVLGSLDLVVPEPQTATVTVEGLSPLRDGAPFRLHVSAEVAESWRRANGLPDMANPVVDSTWDEATATMTLRMSQPAEVVLTFQKNVGEDWQEVGSVSVGLDAKDKTKKVPAPPAVVALIAPWAAPVPTAPAGNGR